MQASETSKVDGRSSAESLDLIWGAHGIASFIGKTTRATFHLLERGQIPSRKVGNQWVASRQKLKEHFEGEQE